MLEREQRAERSFFRGVVTSVGLTILVILFVLIIDLVSILVLEWSGAVGPVQLAGYLIIPLFAGGIFAYDWSRGQRQIAIIGGAISGGASIIIYNTFSLVSGALQIRVRDQFDYTLGFFVEYAVLSLVFLLPISSLLGAGAGLFFSRFYSQLSNLTLNEDAVGQKSVTERKRIPGTAHLPHATIILLFLGAVIVSMGILSRNVEISVFGLLISSVPLMRIGLNLFQRMSDSSNLRLAQAVVIDRKRVKTIEFYSSGSLFLLIFDLIFYGIKLIKMAIKPSYSYSIVFEFNVPLPGGPELTIQLQAGVTRKLYEGSSIGTPISILYDESDPTKVLIKGESEHLRFRSGAFD